MKLEQKRGFQKRTFELNGDKLFLTYKTPSETKEWTANLDSIGTEILVEKKSRKGAIITGILLLAFGVFFLAINASVEENVLPLWAWIFIGLFYAVIGSLIFFVPLKSELHIIGGFTKLTFFLECPSRDVVEKFASQIIELSKKLILERFSKVDGDVPEETMMNQLYLLRNRGLISEKEYENKKQEYKLKKLMK